MSENKPPEAESEMLLSEAQGAPQAAARESEEDPVPDWLQKGLKKLYADVMDEPVPDEFARLLKELADKERG